MTAKPLPLPPRLLDSHSASDVVDRLCGWAHDHKSTVPAATHYLIGAFSQSLAGDDGTIALSYLSRLEVWWENTIADAYEEAEVFSPYDYVLFTSVAQALERVAHDQQ